MRLLHVCLITLIIPLLVLVGTHNPFAQGRRTPNSGAAPTRDASLQTRRVPVVDFHAPLPAGITRRELKPGTTRVGTSGVPQTQDLTPTTAFLDDKNAFWTRDERQIYFQSNRVKDATGNLVAGTNAHIYRMSPGGGAAEALTGPDASPVVGSAAAQTEPTVNTSGSLLCYIESSAGSVYLVEMDLSTATRTTRTLVINNPQGITFTGLNHPEYGSISGVNDGIIFAGQKGAGQPYKIFAVDRQNNNVTQITPDGAADDRNPTLSPSANSTDPNARVLAFDSNRANAAGTATASVRNVWVSTIIPTQLNLTRVTNFSGGSDDCVEPAWSTNVVDQQGIVNGQVLLAFATTRVDPANDGNATTIGTSHDIYFLKANVAQISGQAGYTVTTPEGGSNTAVKLPTGDPNHTYDDRHPTFPQFINTYRVAYNSDRTYHNGFVSPVDSGPNGQPNDIFSSTLIDLNAPTLVRYNSTDGTIVNVTPRNAQPGQTVTFEVKVADLESGVKDVYLQIKNPNSKYQQGAGAEHKVYTRQSLTPDGANFVVGVPVEFESQRINVTNGTYRNPIYSASNSDFFAYTGSTSTPDAGWLKLSPVAGSRDTTNGAVTYRATWTPPTSNDWYIDVIVYDNALNPFNPGGGSSNWKIYDNVWGFSTYPFNPSQNVLFVSDNAAGQKFFSGRFNSGTSAENTDYTFWGTESWMTDIDVSLFPTAYLPTGGGTGGTVFGWQNTLGVDSDNQPGASDGTRVDGRPYPNTQRYDIWRTLARGPIPDTVLSQYAPFTENQPPDTVNGETATRTVTVAPRAVIWHAPYAGGLFVGPGSITDLAVQDQLTRFVGRGGRLLMNGQDIAWALTLNGQQSNTFLSTILKATFVSDLVPGTIRTNGAFFSAQYQLTVAGQPNPLTYDPWLQHNFAFNPVSRHSYIGPPFPPGDADFISTAPNLWMYPGQPGAITNTRDCACPGNGYPDFVSSSATATLTYNLAGSGNIALAYYIDGTSGAKVIYANCGIEGINPQMYAPPNTTALLGMRNRRAELVSNSLCWMRTGTIFGNILDIEGGAPVANALVRLIASKNATGGGVTTYTAYTARTDSNGLFRINGVEPDNYEVVATTSGFSQKRASTQVHGGCQTEVDLKLSRAEPAQIQGQVTRTDGTTPIPGATVTATDNNSTATTFTATTDASGNYNLAKVPAGTTYTLTVMATGYGTSIPLNYTVKDANAPNGLLQPATTYKPYNFQLRPEQGIATGRVLIKNADGSPGGAIAGATVTATFSTQTVTAVTDSTGTYSFNKANTTPNGLEAGSWSLVAVAPGYATSTAISIVVVSNQTTTVPDILLSAVPPGSISGLITRTSDNAALDGVTVQLKDSTGAVRATVTTTTGTTTNGYTYNYKFDTVPAGVTYTVVPSRSGYTPTPATANATVTSGTETQNINFSFDPLYTYSGTLSLVSAPYDYTGYDAGDLLSIPTADRGASWRFINWTLGSYQFYPGPNAKTFKIGRGYFLSYKNNMPLSTLGNTADPTKPYDVPCDPGWNMIGSPFPFEMDWTKVDVVQNGVVIPHDQAIAQGIIGSSLYSYVSGGYILDFKLTPFRGYWVRAFSNISLRFDPVNGKTGRAATIKDSSNALTRSVLQGGQGWSVNLRASVGDVRDDSSHLGVSSRASDGYDGFKAEKPPLIGDRYIYVTFDHDNWGDKSGGYGVDVRSAAIATKAWEFSVKTNVPGQTATLTWPNTALVGRSTTLVMTDLATGQVRDLRSTSSYTWQTGDQPATRRFKIEAVRADMNTLRITGLTAREGATRGAGANISYTLSAPADVEVHILSVSGKHLRKVAGTATRAAGNNEAIWDRRTDDGAVMPAGSYMVELRAKDATGRMVKQAVPFIVTR